MPVLEAAMRLGVMSLRKAALGFTLVSGNRTGVCSSFDYNAFWGGSVALALAAKVVAGVPSMDASVDPEEAYTCALLARIAIFARVANVALPATHDRQRNYSYFKPHQSLPRTGDGNRIHTGARRNCATPHGFATLDTQERQQRRGWHTPRKQRTSEAAR